MCVRVHVRLEELRKKEKRKKEKGKKVLSIPVIIRKKMKSKLYSGLLGQRKRSKNGKNRP